MANTEEQVLLAQVISHLPVELRQRLAARQLTGRLPKARKLPAHAGRHWDYSNATAGPGTCGGKETFRQQPSARRAGKAQYLGEVPWVSRATALWPDAD
jgi:hypothetical protein